MVQEIKESQMRTDEKFDRIIQELKVIKKSHQELNLRFKELETSHQELHEDVEKGNKKRKDLRSNVKEKLEIVCNISTLLSRRVDVLEEKMACSEEKMVCKDELEEKIRNISISETHFHVSESLSIRYKEKRELPTSMIAYEED